jgi:hypothetical protein
MLLTEKGIRVLGTLIEKQLGVNEMGRGQLLSFDPAYATVLERKF